MTWDVWVLFALVIIALLIAGTDSIAGLFFNAIPYMRRLSKRQGKLFISWPVAMRVARDINNTNFLVWIAVNVLFTLNERVVLWWFTTVIIFYIAIRLWAWKTHPQGIKGL